MTGNKLCSVFVLIVCHKWGKKGFKTANLIVKGKGKGKAGILDIALLTGG